ncbi:MAG TPA: D-glycerate dehydrogenase [Dehalococcoidia bacterium]|nr:D-glycerate dehydrogenase [Dehalococcoidia bacterium]
MTADVFVTARLPEETLARLGTVCAPRLRQAAGPLTRAELLESLSGAVGLLCGNSAPLDAQFFASVPPPLRVIAQVGVGYDNVDLAAATKAGIVVTNTPNVLTEAVADLTLGLIVYVCRNLGAFSAYAKTGWGRAAPPAFGVDVHGKTLGIIGLGRIGRAVARRAQAFRMRVLFHDLFREPPPEAPFAEYREKADLLREADIVTLHVDLNPSTRGFIGERELALMKPTAYLINTSRGPVVDQAALTRALEGRRIAGAALDVLEKEPPDPEEPILRLDNAFILSHIGTATVETRQAMIDLAVDNLIAGISGHVPPTVVNTDVIERWQSRLG